MCVYTGTECINRSDNKHIIVSLTYMYMYVPPLLRCRKLPRALKEWDAFEELRKTIDDFNEMVPLLELMANKAMKPRHWNRMQDTCSWVFDVEGENFTLRNILEAPLLQFKEEIEVSI